VEIGQTVVASLNAPSLFLLARDLSRMQVLVQVNEADIGNVHPGQEVSFATDAFGNETFHGAVRKVRLNATMTQNVVTYTVEIDTDNADLKLLPYLTANVKFMVQRHDNVLAVPNAALRWSPAPAPGSRTSRGPAPPTSNGATASRAAAASRPAARESASTVWVLDSGQPRAVRVRVGITDGTMTEVQSSELSEGSQVIVGQEVAAGAGARSSGGPAGSTGETNPFTPQLPRGRGPR
jgi:HlyD family secretion protein